MINLNKGFDIINFTFLIQNNITGCTSTFPTTELVIPSTIGNYNITTISDYAFMNYNLNSVIIPNTIISIGKYAFARNNLTSVIIPSSITSIGNNAFSNNLSLQNVTFMGNYFNPSSNNIFLGDINLLTLNSN